MSLKGEFRQKLYSCQSRWPALRATAVVGMGVDFALIPRALQAEEDMLRYIKEFKGLELAQSFIVRR